MGKVHDQTIAKRTNLNDQLEDLNQRFGIHKENRYFVYGDKAYKKSMYVVSPFKNVPTDNAIQLLFIPSEINPLFICPILGSPEAKLNDSMKSYRIAVEWGFGNTTNYFKFIRDSDSKKYLLQPVGLYLPVATILINIHTCLYGSEVTKYFNSSPPDLEDYLEIE